MKDEVLFTIMASVNGNLIGGRFEFVADDGQEFWENQDDIDDYIDRVFEEVREQ